MVVSRHSSVSTVFVSFSFTGIDGEMGAYKLTWGFSFAYCCKWMNSFDCDDSIELYENWGMANDVVVVGTGSSNDSYYANTVSTENWILDTLRKMLNHNTHDSTQPIHHSLILHRPYIFIQETFTTRTLIYIHIDCNSPTIGVQHKTTICYFPFIMRYVSVYYIRRIVGSSGDCVFVSSVYLVYYLFVAIAINKWCRLVGFSFDFIFSHHRTLLNVSV